MKDIKYIIKRIIIGVGIALVLMFLKGNLALQVKANSISPYQWGGYSYTITSNTTNFNFNVPALPGGGQPWFNHNNGILRFNLSINKLTGDSTQAFPIPRTIVATSGNYRFVCSFGNTQWQNSTFVGVTYSVECPMNLYDNNGVDSVLIAFNPTGMPVNNTYNMTISSDASFEVYEDTQVNVTTDTSSTTNAINNQITNDNQNTTNIINNNNQNTQDIIDSSKVCNVYDKTNGIEDGWLNSNGTITSSSSTSVNYTITDFIPISSSTIEALTGGNRDVRTCFYNTNKSYVSCIDTIPVGFITIPNDASYVRFTIYKQNNKPSFKVCRNGNQAIADTQQEINNTLNDSNVEGSWQSAKNYLENFTINHHGISGIISAPLRLINSLSSSSCHSLSIPLPFVNQNATIPCMSSIYSQFPTFYNLWQLITTGLISYWIVIKIFGKVNEFQDPTSDKVEVLEL